MAGNIKGITVEIGGDTSKLSEAISKVEKQGKSLEGELKEIDKLLKFDPSNTVALAQKQKVLAESVENASEKLQKLRSVQDQVEAQFKSGKLGEDQYRAFQREITKTENALESLKEQQKKASEKIEIEVDSKDVKKAEDAVEDLGDTSEKTGKRASKALGALGVAVGATVGAIGGLVASTNELNMDLARLEANAEISGHSMDKMNENLKKVAAVSGETDSAVETLSNLMATGFSDNQMAEALDYVNGGAIKFSDTLKTEGIADGIQETFATGSAIGQFGELLERSGVDLDKFNTGLANAKKNGTETDYVLQQLAGLGLGETYEAYQKNNSAIAEYNEAQVGLQMALAGLGERLTPLVTMFMNLGIALLEWTNKTFDSLTAMNLFGDGIKSSLPQILQTGTQVITNMIQGITANLPAITATAISVITTYMNSVQTMYPLILEAGVQIITTLLQGIVDNLPVLVEGATGIINSIVETLLSLSANLITAGGEILVSLIAGIVSLLPNLVQTALNLVTTIIETLVSMLPKIVESGIKVLDSLIKGILSLLPQLVPTAVNIIQTLISTIVQNLPKIIDSGVKLLNSLISGITKMLPDLIKTAVELIVAIVKTIGSNLPEILGAGIKIIGKLIEGLVSAIPDIIIAIAKIIRDMIKEFDLADFGDVGKNMIKGLIKGIKSMSKDAIDAISGVVGSVVDKAKSLLEIHSPSRVFESEVGEQVGAGMALGVKNSGKDVVTATSDMIKLAIPKVDNRLVQSATAGGIGSRMQELIVMLDSEILGRKVVDVVGEQIVLRAGGRF